MEASAGRDDCGGAVLGDDGGSGVFLALVKFGARVDFRFSFLAFE